MNIFKVVFEDNLILIDNVARRIAPEDMPSHDSNWHSISWEADEQLSPLIQIKRGESIRAPEDFDLQEYVSAWEAAVPPEEVPEITPLPHLSPLQARVELWDRGLLEQFEAWADRQDVPTRARWRHGAGFARDGSVLVAGLAALGQSAEQIAAFYRAAARRSPLG